MAQSAPNPDINPITGRNAYDEYLDFYRRQRGGGFVDPTPKQLVPPRRQRPPTYQPREAGGTARFGIGGGTGFRVIIDPDTGDYVTVQSNGRRRPATQAEIRRYGGGLSGFDRGPTNPMSYADEQDDYADALWAAAEAAKYRDQAGGYYQGGIDALALQPLEQDPYYQQILNESMNASGFSAEELQKFRSDAITGNAQREANEMQLLEAAIARSGVDSPMSNAIAQQRLRSDSASALMQEQQGIEAMNQEQLRKNREAARANLDRLRSLDLARRQALSGAYMGAGRGVSDFQVPIIPGQSRGSGLQQSAGNQGPQIDPRTGFIRNSGPINTGMSPAQQRMLQGNHQYRVQTGQDVARDARGRPVFGYRM